MGVYNGWKRLFKSRIRTHGVHKAGSAAEELLHGTQTNCVITGVLNNTAAGIYSSPCNPALLNAQLPSCFSEQS